MNFLNYIKRRIIVSKIKRMSCISCVVIETHMITGLSNMKFGEACRVGPGCQINGAGGLEFGANVILGPNVVIWTQNHNYKNSKFIPYDFDVINKPVHIQDGCWLGEGVKVSPGVTIGKFSIIAMGAVVLSDVPPFSIVIGNPGVVKKVRSNTESLLGLDMIKHSYLLNKLNIRK